MIKKSCSIAKTFYDSNLTDTGENDCETEASSSDSEDEHGD